MQPLTRMSRQGSVCAIKGFLSSCNAEATGVCVYCGRPFCQSHGVVLPNGEEVCRRKNCVAKRDDLAKHLEYKDAVLLRNRQRLCGIESCNNPFTGQCGRCKGYFCGKHTDSTYERVFEGQARFDQPASLCKHCQSRRGIWLRD